MTKLTPLEAAVALKMRARLDVWLKINGPRIESMEVDGDALSTGLWRGVYFVAVTTGECAGHCPEHLCDEHHPYIKIGFASDMAARLCGIATGCPFPVRVIAMFDGSRADERAIHAIFREARHQREWFLNCEPIRRLGDLLTDFGGVYADDRP